MREISIKAFLVANLVHLATAFTIFVTVALLGLLVGWGIEGFPADIRPIADGLKGSLLFISLISTISMIPASMVAGYVAGRIATRSHALNGALSSSAWFAILIYILLGGGSSNEPPRTRPPVGTHIPVLLQVGLFPGTPLLFGALGGLVARRRHRDEPEGKQATPTAQLAQRFDGI